MQTFAPALQRKRLVEGFRKEILIPAGTGGKWKEERAGKNYLDFFGKD